MEILLDVNQISIKYPRVLILYADPESLLKDSHYDIMVTDVLSLLSPPTIVLTLDSSSQILQQLTLQVSYIYVHYHVCIRSNHCFTLAIQFVYSYTIAVIIRLLELFSTVARCTTQYIMLTQWRVND